MVKMGLTENLPFGVLFLDTNRMEQSINTIDTMDWEMIVALNELPNFKPETIYSWICAKTLLLLIARKIASSRVSIPPCAK